MAHILIVCTANICRSPVAEALLRDRLHKRGLKHWRVTSAGTWAKWVRGASQFSIDVMEQQGFDISAHQSRMINGIRLREADLVLCMEIGHVEALRVEFPESSDKIYLLSEMVGERYSVRDPYGEPIDKYRLMANELTGLIDAGLEKIISLAEANLKKLVS